MLMDSLCFDTGSLNHNGIPLFSHCEEFIASMKLLKGYLDKMSQEPPLTECRAANGWKFNQALSLVRQGNTHNWIFSIFPEHNKSYDLHVCVLQQGSLAMISHFIRKEKPMCHFHSPGKAQCEVCDKVGVAFKNTICQLPLEMWSTEFKQILK